MQKQQKNRKYNIICMSNQIWHYPLWTNKKHVMTRLAGNGNNVLFVDPPINTGRLFLRQLLAKKWPWSRLFTSISHDGNATIFSPLNFLPFYKFLAYFHAKRINNLAAKLFDPRYPTILWFYHVEIPGLEVYLERLRRDFLVYDCVDNYSAMPQYKTLAKKESVNIKETLLVAKADVVFATAPGLVEKLKKHNEHVYYMPNVGDFDKFYKIKNRVKKLPDDIKNIPHPIIGYTGAIDEYKFDRALYRQLAKDYPSYSFVLIGPMALKDREGSIKELGLADLPNVHFLGTKPFTEVQNYFAAFDAYIIPYQLNDYTVGGCFPIKFHDAMAAGFPIIVTDLPAYRPFDRVCYISKSYNEFSQNIRRALEEDSPEKTETRQLVAKENSWEGKVEKMLNIIQSRML